MAPSARAMAAQASAHAQFSVWRSRHDAPSINSRTAKDCSVASHVHQRALPFPCQIPSARRRVWPLLVAVKWPRESETISVLTVVAHSRTVPYHPAHLFTSASAKRCLAQPTARIATRQVMSPPPAPASSAREPVAVLEPTVRMFLLHNVRRLVCSVSARSSRAQYRAHLSSARRSVRAQRPALATDRPAS